MVEVVKSATFDRWQRKLKDRQTAARVAIRIDRVILLLCGGDKNTQESDIRTAQRISEEWRAQQGHRP